MKPLAVVIADVERRLLALTPEQHDLVADASAGNALEVAAAGAVVSKGFSTGRLDRAEATSLLDILARWNTSSLAERVVCWRAVREVTDPRTARTAGSIARFAPDTVAS